MFLKTQRDYFEENGLDYHIIDDGSDYDIENRVDPSRLTQLEHGGKKGFWRIMQEAFKVALDSPHDSFVFLADDFLHVEYLELQNLARYWKDSEYCINLINDGRDECWGKYRLGLKPIPYGVNQLIEVGFCDCGFMTNRRSLEQIKLEPVPEKWFDRPEKSSGVGYQLTVQFRIHGIPMLKPLKSFAHHGDHESKMHKEHRANQIKLISR